MHMRVQTFFVVAILVGTLALTGCKKDEAAPVKSATPAPAAAPEKQPEPEPEPAEPEEKAAEEPAEDSTRVKLASAFHALYCAQKANAEGDLLAIYGQHGFESAAVWSTKWDSEARKDPAWAESTVAAALDQDCKKPSK